MIGIETFVVNTDRVHLVLFQVKFDIFSFIKCLVAHGAAGIVGQPLVDALWVEDMEAAHHAAVWFVTNRVQAYDAFFHHELAVFHSDQDLLEFVILFSWETFVNRQPCSMNKLVVGWSLSVATDVVLYSSVSSLLLHFIGFICLTLTWLYCINIVSALPLLACSLPGNQVVYLIVMVSVHLNHPLLPDIV